MEKCKNCGSELKSREEQESISRARSNAGKHWSYFRQFCDGVLTYDTDPFQEEIRGDFSEYWDCQGGRYLSAMEI